MKLRKFIILSALVFTSVVHLKAQAPTFVYLFIAPRSVISTNFSSTMDSVLCPIGYARTVINASNVARFRAVAPPRILYVYNQLQAGTPLRNNVNKVFRNSGGTVDLMQYWLADDRTGFSGLAADTLGIFVQYLDNGTKYVWPAANNWSRTANRFGGYAMFGEHELESSVTNRTGGIKSIDEVVLHETSHTQWTGEWTKWGSVNGSPITYGADGMHYLTIAELIGDQEGAINEGLATFYGYTMNDTAVTEMMSFFARADERYFVEARSVLAGSGALYTVPDRVEARLNKNYDDGSPITIFKYKWKSVPGFYLLFAEITSVAYFTFFYNNTYSNKDTAFSMIGNTALAMSADRRKRFLTYACNRLALRMEAYNNGAGRNDASKVSSLFPFALLDLLTHFGMTDAEYQADYRRNYADRDPRAYSEYFSRRAAIKALVQADLDASPIRFNQALQALLNYCKQAANIL